MKAIQIITAFVLLISANVSHASVALTEQIKLELIDELYPISNVVPGYRRPENEAPKFAIAEFRAGSDELKNWSQAISEILRYRIQYVPGVRLVMPAAYNMAVDSGVNTRANRPLLVNQSHFLNLKKALDIQHVLTGEVSRRGSDIVLLVEMVNAGTGETSSQKKWEFPQQQLADTIIDISTWIYATLSVDLSKDELAYLNDRETLSNAAIEAFVENYSEFPKLNPVLRREKINQLLKQHPEFTLLSVYALHNRAYANNLDEAYKNIELYKHIKSLNPGNVGVELEIYHALDVGVMPKHEIAARLNGMKRLVLENPQSAPMMLGLADVLVKNGDTVSAISVMLEAVARWPQNYRAWWSLGWALNQHAWQVRGGSFWRDVPERAKKKFKTLTPLANQIIDIALSLNKLNPSLWNMKLKALGSVDGFSEELLSVFNEAARLAPKRKSIYSSALNYSGENWGGNREARRHIIEMAEKNNPGQGWPEIMRSQNAEDFGRPKRSRNVSSVEQYFWDLLDKPYGSKVIVFVIIFLLWIVFLLGRWSVSAKGNYRNDTEDYYGYSSLTEASSRKQRTL